MMTPLPYKWKALLTVAMGTMTATLDASITNMAFPELTRVFETDLATVMWVAVAYILVSSGLMLLFGKLSDSIGTSRIYAVGLVVFTLAMAACSLAQSIEQLILFRVVQAVGAAMSIGCSTAIVTKAFPSQEMGKGLGLLGVSVSAGFIVGPVIGGVLLDWLDWRAIFYMRIPLGVLTFALAFILLRRDVPQKEQMDLDLLGTLTSFGGLFCLLFGMGQIKALGITSPLVLLCMGMGVLLLYLFVGIERRAGDPIVDLTLFRNRPFSYAMAGLFLFFLAAPPYMVIMPFYLMEGISFSPLKSGLLLSVVPVTTMVVGLISGTLSDRFGPQWPSTIGAGAMTGAFLGMLWFDLHTGVGMIVFLLVLLGIGIGAFQPPNSRIIMGSVETRRLGSASALIATERQVGISIGMALSGALFAARQSSYEDFFRLQGYEPVWVLRHAIPPAFRDVLLISFLLCVGVLVLSLLAGKIKPPGKE